MKLQCQRDSLLSAASIVQAAVATTTTKPILKNIKAIAQDDALILMATDLEIGIRYELRGVTVTRAGTAILPVSKLISILKETHESDIYIDATEHKIHIHMEGGKYDLLAMNPDEFPDIPGFDHQGSYQEMLAGVLRTMLKRVAFATEKKESTRWAVTGVLWEAEGDQVRLVATDTKRLAMMTGPATTQGNTETTAPGKAISHLIPHKAITLLERSLHDDGEMVQVAMKTNEAMFQTERALIHTRLVEGKFPPYQTIIPKKLTKRLELDNSEFYSKIRQAAITSDEESKRVNLHFEPGKLTLNARGPETGASEVVMDLPQYQDQELRIGFDPQFLTEMFRVIDGEPTVILEMTDAEKPAIFRVGDHYLYLVMPMGE